MHSFGYLLVLCIPYTYSAVQVEFNTSKRVYNVGDDVKLSCFINTSWMVVSFYRRNTILIGDCFAPSNVCFPTNHTVSHKRYTLLMENSNPVLYINNVTKEDSDVTFTCLWTSFRDTVSFYVQDPITTTTPSSPNEENRTNSIWTTVGIVLGALVFISVVVSVVWYVCIHNRLWKNDTINLMIKRIHAHYTNDFVTEGHHDGDTETPNRGVTEIRNGGHRTTFFI